MNHREKKQYQRDRFSGWQAIAVIAMACLAWALLLSAGSWMQFRATPIRSLIIIALPILFVAVWASLVFVRSRKGR